MQLFPGRTLEELDDMDDARVYCALEAREISRHCRLVEGWLTGETTVAQFQSVDQSVAKAYMAAKKKKRK